MDADVAAAGQASVATACAKGVVNDAGGLASATGKTCVVGSGAATAGGAADIAPLAPLASLV